MSKIKRLWEEKWVKRRHELGATHTFLKKIVLEAHREYHATLKMCGGSFNFVLIKGQSQIQRNVTHLRNAVSAKSDGVALTRQKIIY